MSSYPEDNVMIKLLFVSACSYPLAFFFNLFLNEFKKFRSQSMRDYKKKKEIVTNLKIFSTEKATMVIKFIVLLNTE